MYNSKPILKRNDFGIWFSSNNYELRSQTDYKNYHWKTNGASCLALVAKEIIEEKGKRIRMLLPGYFCSQSLRYLRSLSVELVFYPLTVNLLPDFLEIEKIIKKKRIDIFLHVHYFGKISGQKESRAFSNKTETILVEDCAHIVSNSCSEWVGDFLIFSPHKHFALPEIGLLIENSNKQRLSIRESNTKYFPILWFIKQIIKSLIRFSSTTKWNLAWSSESEMLQPYLPNNRVINTSSKYLVEVDNCIKKRKENTEALLNTLESIGEWQPFVDMTSQTTPYLVGMRCKNRSIAKRRLMMLNKRNQLVMQWPDLPNEIIRNESICNQAKDWQETVLFFFIHQQIDTTEWLEEIANIINSEKF